jgi:hypothetical protein
VVKNSLCFILFLFSSIYLLAQDEPQVKKETCHCPGMAKAGKGTFYFAFGYNLDWFTNSDIHFKDHTTENYEFTLSSVKAEDRPNIDKVFKQDITLPQYSYRIGYFFNNKKDMGIEINYDHVKYIVLQDQVVHITGQIHDVFLDQDTVLDEHFIRYEHTNGANYFMLNAVKRFNFLKSKNELHWFSGMLRAGAGPVVPRTESYLWGNHRDNCYHLAGYVMGIDLGLRYDFLKNFFLETNAKGAWANYTNVYLYGDGRAKQSWFSFEYIFTIGGQFGW